MRFFILVLVALLVSVPAHAEIQKVTAKNGLTAWLIEDHNLPIASLAFGWRGGIEQDPEDKQGLSYLAAAMMTQGAGADDANAFQKKLNDNAIKLDIGAERDARKGSLRSLKETLETATQMLKESLSAPRFEASAMQRVRGEVLSNLKLYESDPDWLLSRMMMREVFAGQDYAKRTLGTAQSVQRLTQADLKTWHKDLTRKDLIIAAAGDLTPAELSNILDDVFGVLPAGKEEAPSGAQVFKGSGETFLLKHAGTQSMLAFVWPGISRNDPDWYAAEVMNYILGGGSFSSRLMKEIRDKRGLTYGISSGMMLFDAASLYIVQGSMANEKAGEVLKLARAEFKRITDEKVTDKELQGAKDYLIGSYATSLTSTSSVAQHLLELQRKGLPMDEQEKRAAAIRSVTAADVQKVAKRLLVPNGDAVFLVGGPQGVTPTKVFESID
jgi:zinc protease